MVIPLDFYTVDWGICPIIPAVISIASFPDPAIPLPASVVLDSASAPPRIRILETDGTLHGVYGMKVTYAVGNSVHEFTFDVRMICTVSSLTPPVVAAWQYRLLNDPVLIPIGFIANQACGVPQIEISTDLDPAFGTDKGFIKV